MKPREALRELVVRRECRALTWKGWLLLALLGGAIAVTAVSRIHPYLAVTRPVPANALVIEGWAPTYLLEEARAEFGRRHYGRLYVTGGPLEIGGPLSQYRTYAELGAASLIRMGMSKDVIVAVPAYPVRQDRTYASALALSNWMRQYAPGDTSINVVSMGAHARRTLLLFAKAFADGSRVGIIAVEDRDYDAEHWWRFSQGVRIVVGKQNAYAYALFVFPFV